MCDVIICSRLIKVHYYSSSSSTFWD